MLTISAKEVQQAFKAVGIKSGDLILVHSDLRSFGIPEISSSREKMLYFYYDNFRAVLGPEGTLAVPAYFYEFARSGKPFDVERSPVSKELGVFSAFVNTFPDRKRSFNPLQSIAAVGPKAKELCGTSLAGYGEASPWHRLRKMGGKLVFFGTTLQPMTYVHHIEQQYGVPHLYTKIYPYPILRNGIPFTGQAISSVRFLDYAVEYALDPFQQELEKTGILQHSTCGSGNILAGDADAIFKLGMELLQKNPYFFLKHPPAFIRGKIPLDGIK